MSNWFLTRCAAAKTVMGPLVSFIISVRDMQVRPYLMADGGNVEFIEIDGLVVKLKLQGACGSCPSSMTTMTMGIKRRLMEKIPVRSSPCTIAQFFLREILAGYSDEGFGVGVTGRGIVLGKPRAP